MPKHEVPPRLRSAAKRLRRDLTAAEERLWLELRGKRFFGAVFRRQVPIGAYVADIVCHEARLVVEVDGDTHDRPGAAERDEQRTAYLNSIGYRVVRVDNPEVYGNLEGVLVEIGRHIPGFETDLAVDPPLPVPPPPGGRGRKRRDVGAVKAVSGVSREYISGLNADPAFPPPGGGGTGRGGRRQRNQRRSARPGDALAQGQVTS